MPLLGTRGGASNRGFGFGGLSVPSPVTSTSGLAGTDFIFEQSNGDLEIRWVDPTFTGSLPLLDISVSLTDGVTTFEQTIGVGVGITTFSGLTIGTNYTVSIRARNNIGFSGARTDSGFASIPPNPPTITTCFNGRNKTLIFNWINPTGLDTGGVPLTRYQLRWTDTVIGTVFTTTRNLVPTGTDTVTADVYNRQYILQVSVGNARGFSDFSGLSNGVSTTTTAPDPPTIGTATRGDGRATISFTAPGNDGNADINLYIATSTPGSIIGTRTQSPITVTGLTNGTSYTFVVQARNGFATGGASAASNSVVPAGVPTAPTIGTATRTNATEATVSYTASSSNNGEAITSYTAVSSPGGLTGTRAGATSGTITVTGLSPSSTYTFTVFATNAVGNSASSAASNSVEDGLPGAPTIGTASRASGTSASVPFTAPVDDGPPGSPITSYTAVSTPGGLTGTRAGATSGTITVSGLTSGTYYNFRVFATNAGGNGPNSANSNTVPIGNPPTTNPTFVATYVYNLQASVVLSQVTLASLGGWQYSDCSYELEVNNSTRSITQTDTFTLSDLSSSSNPRYYRVINLNGASYGDSIRFRVRVSNPNGATTFTAYTTAQIAYFFGESSWVRQTANWAVPANVSTVSVVVVGGGGGADWNGSGGGGGLAYVNNLSVTGTNTVVAGGGGSNGGPNQPLGQPGAQSYFRNTSTVRATAGGGGNRTTGTGGSGGAFVAGTGGGSGGAGGVGSPTDSGGGGGAGGYAGSGGAGGSDVVRGTGGTGGAGAGGFNSNGGGTGIYGMGYSGYDGAPTLGSGQQGSIGSAYGNGGGAWTGSGGDGAVRIIYPGAIRSFGDPSIFSGQNISDIPDPPTLNQFPTASSTTSILVTWQHQQNFGRSPSFEIVWQLEDILGNVTTLTDTLSPTGRSYGTRTFSSLTANRAYRVRAQLGNSYGRSGFSAYTPYVTPGRIGQNTFSNPGTFSWQVPAGVTSVSVVAVGGGGGADWNASGGGGGLRYRNNISVTQYSFETVIVGGGGGNGGPNQPLGQTGGTSIFRGAPTLSANGGGGGNRTTGVGGAGGGGIGAAGGNGGAGGTGSGANSGGGGGAGGYAGNGGTGAPETGTGTSGTGGAGAGGFNRNGGGVGILGQGNNGAYPGGSGSTNTGSAAFGGGGGDWSGDGGGGAVRIIYPGNTRSFPSTSTGDL